MKVINNLENMREVTSPVVLAVGFFDGIHRGHQAVLDQAGKEAREKGAETWVLTFEPHPLKVIRPDIAPPLLTSLPHKTRLLERLGVSGICVVEFTPSLRSMEATDFVRSLVRSIPDLRGIVVGMNWRFGRDQQGNTTLLQQMAPRHNISVTPVAHVDFDGMPVSSTRIRDALKHGALEDTERMLGRPFSIYGDVVDGRGIGTELGYPTANVDPHSEVHPPAGIYAGYGLLDSRKYKAAIYIGSRPTFQHEGGQFVVEVHLMDVDLDMYGRELEVFLVQKLRDDERFASKEALREQISKDVATIRKLLAERFQRAAGQD